MRAPGRLLFIGALLLASAWPTPSQAQAESSEVAEELEPGEPEAPGEPEPPEDAAELDELTSLLAETPVDAGTRPAKPRAASAGAIAPAAPKPPAIQLAKASEAALEAAWARWRVASSDLRSAEAESARAELLALRDELALPSLEAHSIALARAADRRRQAGDSAAAVSLASTAVELSPQLPAARVALAAAHFSADATAVGKVAHELAAAFAGLKNDPRYLRPTLASLGAALLLALLATAGGVALVFFARYARYYLHDWHHLLPRGAARWQSLVFGGLLVGAPVLLRLGAAPAIFALFAAVAFYLPFRERLVAAALLASLGLLPVGAAALARHTALAETPADDLLAIERGGREAGAALARVERRVLEQRATEPELFVLGRDELRRGKLEQAMAHLQAATNARADDARALVCLGNALAARGELSGAAAIYEGASMADPALAAAPYNLARVLELGTTGLPADQAAAQLDGVRAALAKAKQLDPSLETGPWAGELRLNRLLLSPAPPRARLLALADPGSDPERVGTQVTRLAVLGRLELPLQGLTPLAALLPLALSGVLLGLASLRTTLSASKVCNKCGRPVCRRCDAELARGSEMCQQCVNAFAHKGVVPPPLQAKKQDEVARYHSRMDKAALALGLCCSGAGHLFSGLPVRGAVYLFGFAFALVTACLGAGALRTPYGDPLWGLRWGLAGALFLAVYLLPLYGLFKRQSE